MWNLKKEIQANLFTKQKQTQTQKRNMIAIGERRWGGGQGDKLGIQDEQKYTIMHKIDKQQGPTVQHRELYIQYLVITYNGKECKYIHISSIGKLYTHTHTHTHTHTRILPCEQMWANLLEDKPPHGV